MKEQVVKKMMRFSAMLLLAVVAAGCANNNSKTEVRELRVDKDAAMIEIIAAFGDEGVPFLEGSVVERDKDGTFYVRLPKG